MESHLKAIVLDALEKTAQAETENLVLTPKTLEDYLRIVGRVQGLRLAMEIIEDKYTEYMKS